MPIDPRLMMLAQMAQPGQGMPPTLAPRMGQPMGGMGGMPMTPPPDMPPPPMGGGGMPPGMPMPGGPMMPGAAPGGPQGAGPPGGPPMGGGMPSMPPGPPPMSPRHVIRPVGGPLPSAAARGRGGDTMTAHMTPGEIAVPPQIQTPDVLTTLNKAFSQAGANPTSYQAGSPDQKINPETGLPEFGFFDAILPTVLGIAGSAFLGPEILPMLGAGGLGLGEGAAGLIAPAIGGALGSTVGNVATGHPIGQSLAMGALGGVGSAAGSALLGGFAPPSPDVGAAQSLASTAASTAPPATAGIGGDVGAQALAGAQPDYGAMAKQYLAANPAPAANTSLAATGGLYDAAKSGGFKSAFMKALGLDNIPGAIGGTIGGAIGSGIGENMFPTTHKPLKATPDSFASGPSIYQPRPAPTFQTPDQLRNYGSGPQFNYFPV